MPLNISDIKKILVVSLTNIGDVILTLPVVDVLKRDFKGAQLSIVIGPKAASLLKDDQAFERVYIYDKHQPVMTTIRWVWHLRQQRFDLVVDLRNSAIPFLIAPKFRTRPAKIKQENIHMKDKHLKRLASVHTFDQKRPQPSLLAVSAPDKRMVDELLENAPGPFVVIAPGSAYYAKRWGAPQFAELIRQLQMESPWPLIFVGDDKDKKVTKEINNFFSTPLIDLAGKTTLAQLAEIIQRAKLVISNDSAAMHLASYLNKPVLALFGPSDPHKYGPWSAQSCYIQAPVVDEEVDINTITPEEALARLNFKGPTIFHEQRI